MKFYINNNVGCKIASLQGSIRYKGSNGENLASYRFFGSIIYK